METIFALASGQGKAGVAVIRISGPEARCAAERLTGGHLPGRGMCFRTLCGPGGGRLDDALVLTFEAPASFTGETVAELQVHGSRAGVQALLGVLGEIEGLRPAEPGEFTRRALENGKLDLTQVEGLADLIDAETEAQRKQADRVLSGALGRMAEGWRRSLIRATALIEATIDFADEEVPVDVSPEVEVLVSEVQRDLQREIAGVAVTERIRNGFEVAIIGAPNVGKSTLLNALAGRKAAITSEHAGTTRDVIEVHMDLGGLPVTILDTAGMRETEDAVEKVGISVAKDRASQADLRVFLAEDDEDLPIAVQPGDIRVLPKADRRESADDAVSGLTGAGVDRLISRLTDVLGERAACAGTATRDRHRRDMLRADAGLSAMRAILSKGPDQYDIAAEELRGAIRALESLVGRIDVETYLDEIFASFCLGK